jgi:5-methylcytosine-specific restriction enzyme A
MQRAPRICSCGLKVAHGAVCICRQRRKAEADRARPAARQRGYDSRWDKARRTFLRANPWCACCGNRATHVDHIVAHGGDQRLFWNKDNWQPLCQACHSRKTAATDGGFGNPRENGSSKEPFRRRPGVVANFGQGSPDRAGWLARDTSGFSRPAGEEIREHGE